MDRLGLTFDALARHEDSNLRSHFVGLWKWCVKCKTFHRHRSLYVGKCSDIFYDFISVTHQQMHTHIVFNNLKFTLKHLKRSYMFRSYDHSEGAYFVPW